ncbi:hypothetical protein [Alkalibacillus haloalkaliphilus]|uniref:Lipoprotein n=1 Tax=Alkalibacillus haloalkaliphilus TaxID=94136 RepID=A0A511W2F5_9BACI|nr:hypothetical protein [Alkalibacillus haloalkaliphilus]GEN45255.1 hypothetical protein AHA02nite_10310 [Alkalibacillus haloalkaliphilus]
MKFYITVVAVLILFLSGCQSVETETVDGKIHGIDQENETLVIYVGSHLTEEEKINNKVESEREHIEAFMVEMVGEAEIEGEVSTFEELRRFQKVEVEIQGDYTPDLVTGNELISKHEELTKYTAEGISVIPYTKEDLVQELTVEQGEFALHAFNEEDNGLGQYHDSEGEHVFTLLTSRGTSEDDVRNIEELLNIYTNSTTYIITDHEGVVLHTNDQADIEEFVEGLDNE